VTPQFSERAGRSGDVDPVRGDGLTAPPRTVAGRYRLDSVIGYGSTGTVWAATDQVLGRRVALKKINMSRDIRPADAQQVRDRALREARTIATLSNPYVITIFDILDESDTGPIIVMEFIQGRSLGYIIQQAGRLSPGQSATIGVATGSALLAAHAAGITHRDVKPANILISDDGRVKLTDFGTARNTEDLATTRAGVVVGSPAYLAPELASGAPANPMSDGWSLGATLFACVEGRPPFDRGTPRETIKSVVNDPVPPHFLAGDLHQVISGLLVKTPELRMDIESALPMLRAVANDPSGTYVALS
jgi:eukaryotic-like serine/threonine-protein kinase